MSEVLNNLCDKLSSHYTVSGRTLGNSNSNLFAFRRDVLPVQSSTQSIPTNNSGNKVRSIKIPINSPYCSVHDEHTRYIKKSHNVIACTGCNFLKKFILPSDSEIMYFIMPYDTSEKSIFGQKCVKCKNNQAIYGCINVSCLIDGIQYNCMDTTTPTCDQCHREICISTNHQICAQTDTMLQIIKLQSKL